MSDSLLESMRHRAKLCRRLAEATHDEKIRRELLAFADSIEADIARYEDEDNEA